MKKDIESIVNSMQHPDEALKLIAALRARFDMVGAELPRQRIEEIADEIIGDRNEDFFGHEDRSAEAAALLKDLIPGISDQVLAQESFSMELAMVSAAANRAISSIPEIIDLQIISYETDEPYSVHLFTEVNGSEMEVATVMHADLVEGHAWANAMRGKTISALNDDGFQLNPHVPLESILTGHAIGIPQVSETQKEICFRSR